MKNQFNWVSRTAALLAVAVIVISVLGSSVEGKLKSKSHHHHHKRRGGISNARSVEPMAASAEGGATFTDADGVPAEPQDKDRQQFTGQKDARRKSKSRRQRLLELEARMTKLKAEPERFAMLGLQKHVVTSENIGSIHSMRNEKGEPVKRRSGGGSRLAGRTIGSKVRRRKMKSLGRGGAGHGTGSGSGSTSHFDDDEFSLNFHDTDRGRAPPRKTTSHTWALG